MNNQPRELTTQEVKDAFLEHVRSMARYWSEQPGGKGQCLDGLAFSILVAIDGCSALPGFILAPRPHESDKAYLAREGDNWFPENHKAEARIKGNIAGSLHDEFYTKGPTQ